MSLNVKKSACIRVGARFNIDCCRIVTKQGCELSWVESISYLGIHLVSASSLKCSSDNAKRSFYCSFNTIYGKVCRIASSEVIDNVELTKSKCFPAMYYALEASSLRVSQFKSINYVIRSTFRQNL